MTLQKLNLMQWESEGWYSEQKKKSNWIGLQTERIIKSLLWANYLQMTEHQGAREKKIMTGCLNSNKKFLIGF